MQKKYLMIFNTHSWFKNEKVVSTLGIEENFLSLEKMICHSIKTEQFCSFTCSQLTDIFSNDFLKAEI